MHRLSWWLTTALIGSNVALVQQLVVAQSPTEIGRMTQAIRIKSNGDSLIHRNPTSKGLSDGSVLNDSGELVAIHGLGVQLDQKNTTLSLSQSLTASDYFTRATSKYYQQDYKGAIADYTEVIKIDANNADAYHNRGLAKANYTSPVSSNTSTFATNPPNHGEAIVDYSKAISINPRVAVFYSNRATSYAATKKYNEAISDYTKAIEINPDDSYFYFQRATVHNQNDDHDSAIRDYKISEAKINPKRSSEYSRRGYIRYEYLQRHQGAINDYTKAIELAPGNPTLYRDRASVYVDSKQDLLAIADYTQAIYFDSDSDYERVDYFERGSAYRRLGKYQQAIADYKKSHPQECLNTDGYTIMVCEEMGFVKLDLGDYRGAFSNFDQIIKIGYSSPQYYYHRGLARQNTGDQEGAKQDYQVVVNSEDDTIGYQSGYQSKYRKKYRYEFLFYRGSAYFGLGKIPSAIANLTEAIKLEPNNPEAYHYRGVAYQALKDRNSAIKDFQMADRLYLRENRLSKHRIVTQLLRKI